MNPFVEMKQKKRQEQRSPEYDSFHDKRRLLSYWKSLESPPTVSEESLQVDDIKDDLLVELRKCVSELESLDSGISETEHGEIISLQYEQISLIDQLKSYSALTSLETLDLNHNVNGKNDSLTKQSERDAIIKENEKLLQQIKKQEKEYKTTREEQQRDIEKLTREVQNFNISRRKLERELTQLKKQKTDNEATIVSLQKEIKMITESHKAEILKLSKINEQVTQENNELAEKGKEATEGLKIALHQLSEEKKVIQGQKKSGKNIREMELAIDRVKKEREAFRQRCEKNELVHGKLQVELSTLKNELELKNRKLARISSREFVDSEDGLAEKSRESSRIAQLKKYVHVLEESNKEKSETILTLRKENARANDITMEKSLELSKTRRILERKIEKLTNENSDLKRNIVIRSNYSRKSQNTPEAKEGLLTQKQDKPFDEENRRLSNPERWAIEEAERQHREKNQIPSSELKTTAGEALETGKPKEAPARKRNTGKLIREGFHRHSADLGKLMSRSEPFIHRKLNSDVIHDEKPATIFVNKFRKKSEDEEHWV